MNIQGFGLATPVAVISLKINDNVDSETQIAIEAQSLTADGLSADPADGVYWCNIVVIGDPLTP